MNKIFAKTTNQVPSGAAISSLELLTAKMLSDGGAMSYDMLKTFAQENGINVAAAHNLLENIDGFQWTAFNADSVTTDANGQIVSFNLKTNGATPK